MTREEILNKKKELGLENLKDADILLMAIKCSNELKMTLRDSGTNLNNKNIIDTLGKVDDLLLTEWNRVRDFDTESNMNEQMFDLD